MEVLGLLDTLESIILDSSKVPFTKKVVVDEEKLLSIIDKIRLVLQGGSNFAKKAIADVETKEPPAAEGEAKPRSSSREAEVIEHAYQMAKDIREGADKYADEVLANLEATSTRILRTIKAGRDRLKGEVGK